MSRRDYNFLSQTHRHRVELRTRLQRRRQIVIPVGEYVVGEGKKPIVARSARQSVPRPVIKYGALFLQEVRSIKALTAAGSVPQVLLSGYEVAFGIPLSENCIQRIAVPRFE